MHRMICESSPKEKDNTTHIENHQKIFPVTHLAPFALESKALKSLVGIEVDAIAHGTSLDRRQMSSNIRRQNTAIDTQ